MRHSRKTGPTQLELPLGLDPEPLAQEAKAPVALAPIPAAPKAQAPAPAPAPADPPRAGLRVIQGGGERVQEALSSRDAVVRVLVEAGADLLLRRITAERAEYIERSVNQILDLFDRVDAVPQLMPVLKRQLDELEALMTETRAQRSRRPG